MIKNFFKRNWIYIVFLLFIISLNVFLRVERPGDAKEVLVEAAKPQTEESLFIDFDEAQRRSKKIETKIRENPPLYIFYLSSNLLIVLVFLIGLFISGYFIFSKMNRREILRRTSAVLEPPAWSIAEIFKIVILAVTASYIFFIFFGFAMGIAEAISKAKFEFYNSGNFRMIFDTIVLDGCVLLVTLWFLRNVHKKRIRDMGFAKENIGRNIFYGFCGYAGVLPAVFIIGIIVYIILNIFKLKPPPQPIVGLFLAEKNIALIFVSSLIASIFGPIIEEIFFRGVMYNALKRKVGIFWSIFITSVLFSFLHTHAMSYFLVGFITIAILGAVLAYLYEKTGSLIPSITLHILNNLGSVFMVFLFKYFSSLAV